jgi:hypothetical protein
MAVVEISCPSCGHVTLIERSKLPAGRAAFGCPGCKKKVVVDPATLGNPGSDQSPATPASPSARRARPAVAVMPSGPQLGASLAEPARDLRLPDAVCFGDNLPAIESLKAALAVHGSKVEVLSMAEEIVSRPPEDMPALLFCVTKTASAPPVEAMRPLLDLHPSARRRMYLVLLADNLKTLDGAHAFFHQANLLIATSDIPRVATALDLGLRFHQQLVGGFLAELEAQGRL